MHAPAKLIGPIAAAASSGSSDHVGHSAADAVSVGVGEGDGVSLGVTDGEGVTLGLADGLGDSAGEVHPARVTRAMAAMARVRFMRQR